MEGAAVCATSPVSFSRPVSLTVRTFARTGAFGRIGDVGQPSYFSERPGIKARQGGRLGIPLLRFTRFGTGFRGRRLKQCPRIFAISWGGLFQGKRIPMCLSFEVKFPGFSCRSWFIERRIQVTGTTHGKGMRRYGRNLGS